MKVGKRVIIGVGIAVCLIVITSCCLWSSYKGQPKYILNKYLEAINNRDYSTAVSYMYKDEKLLSFTEEALSNFIQNYFEEKEFIKVKATSSKIGDQSKDAKKKFYEVKYNFATKSITNTLSLIQIENKWQVVFPFRIEDIHIYTPLGSSVWFDDQQVTDKEDNKYVVKNVLPGNYVVRVVFPNEMCGDYVTTINVPTETEVIVPYQTVEVSVECMSGTVVELGGEQQVNKDGVVLFENVLEGTYPLKIYDTYGNIETYEEPISVSQENRSFNVEKFTLSTLGNERLKKSVDNFYSAYIDGIKNHESNFINDFAVAEISAHLIEEFEAWFVDGKNLKDARMEVEIEQINMNSEGVVEVETLEVVKMTNKEADAGGKIYEREYQVTLKWIMELIREGESYKLKDRTIAESLVSYKDKDGRWVAY
ncbi:zinc ribbon domain-containing protein [Niameybacter massiliensis]|uniref:hypothetical protein n=1 Tax=Niameybacter massiliensis TaxID=1658108 RepID=UPI0006B4F3C8|nr:hypothetical protein [Niameybacter massiliensis]